MAVALASIVTISGWIAIGSAPPPPAQSEVLTSPEQSFDDGAREWVPIQFGGSGGFTDVVRGAEGIVAVGTGRRIDAKPFAFQSDDGISWNAGVLPAQPGDVISSVVWTGEAYLATGFRPDLDSGIPPAARPAVWSSPDGITWSELPPDGLPPNGTIVRAVFDGTRITAIGWDGPGRFEPKTPLPSEAEGRVWSSEDGRSWTDVTPAGTTLAFTDIIEVDGALVVGGAAGGEPAVWTETGAQQWQQTTIDTPSEGQTVVSIAGKEGELLAIVRSAADVEGIVSVWSAEAGERWTRVDRQVRPDSSGWVRWVDGTLFAGAGFTRTVFPNAPELWASASGNRWTGVEVTSGVSPWPPTVIAAVSKTGDQVTAFGSRGGMPTAWTLEPPQRDSSER
jgi:hypothetical protein